MNGSWTNWKISPSPSEKNLPLLKEGILFLITLFASDVLVMKKLVIEKTKPTFIISTFKTDAIKVGLVFSISNFFIAKTSLANNWRSFSSSYLALECR